MQTEFDFGQEQPSNTPYLIVPPTKHHRWLLKKGIWSNGKYGGIKRWTVVARCTTLHELLLEMKDRT